MHRKSLPVCVFLILTSMVSFLGCSFSASGSSAQAKGSAVTEGGQAAGADMVENDGADADVSGTEDVDIETARAIFKKSGDRSKGKSSQSNASSGKKRATVQKCLVPEASGTLTYGDNTISIDASNTSEGYVMVCYKGSASKVKLQITVPDATVYTYTLAGGGSYETFPLSSGNGKYRLDVLENAYDDMYALALSQEISVTIADEFRPFLYPNQYAWFTQEDDAVSCAAELSGTSSGDLNFVEQVYLYVIKNITYDEELAATVKSGYLPDVDRTLKSKKGICFDYAALMAAMLRSQNVPTKLQIGYSGDAYHAWISVYITEIGWVDNIIEFDGKHWSLMDPTLAASNSRSSVEKYIGDGSKYTVKYTY